MTPEDAVNIQQRVATAYADFQKVCHERDQIFVQLYRQGWTARNIAKLVGINHSPVYRILERGGYQPVRSFREDRLLRDAQRAVVAKAKMAAQAKP